MSQVFQCVSRGVHREKRVIRHRSEQSAVFPNRVQHDLMYMTCRGTDESGHLVGEPS